MAVGTSRTRQIFQTLTVLGAVVALQSGQAAGEASLLKLAMCKQIKNDGARLKCYDAAFEAAKEEPSGETPAVGAWKIEDTRSPVDDRPMYTASLGSKDQKAVIATRCKDGKTEFFIAPGDFFVSKSGMFGDRIHVVIRVNNSPAVTERWLPAGNSRAAFSPSPVATLQALPDNATVFFRVSDFQDVSHDSTYEIGEFSKVRDRIRQMCKWPDPKPKAKITAQPQ